MELPLVNSAYSEVTRIASPITPYVESTLTNMSPTLESMSAAVEKVDCYACCGIDQLTEKMPQLKEAPPKLMEETKTSLTSYFTAVTDYAASFSVAQLALKVADAGLNVVEDVLKKTGTNQESTVVSGVRNPLHCQRHPTLRDQRGRHR